VLRTAGVAADRRGTVNHDAMSGGSWPYLPQQCPRCAYVQAFEPYVDDSGYEICGFCRHPLIAMELFVPRERDPASFGSCQLFVPAAQGGSGYDRARR
jgi:hypothetical protein